MAAYPEESGFDLFLSHASVDKPWVRTLAEALEARGLSVYLDERQLRPGGNYIVDLGEALVNSRYLLLILSTHSVNRRWVMQEWTAFLASQGPLGRVLPIVIEPVELPKILAPTQAIRALHRDAAQIAQTVFEAVGSRAALSHHDPRHHFLGRDMRFILARQDDQLQLTTPDGTTRTQPLPWRDDSNAFGLAWRDYQTLTHQPLRDDKQRAEAFASARTLGKALHATLFDQAASTYLEAMAKPGAKRPVITISSDDDLLLSLPWELLHDEHGFLLRDERIDVQRTTPNAVAPRTLLREPEQPFKLLINISAPKGSQLFYENESYRIDLALTGRCQLAHTELGTLEDLAATIKSEKPRGIHFSGHGSPGALHFENDEGDDHKVSIKDLLAKLKATLPDEQPAPPFFYLASCHGNTFSQLNDGEPGTPGSASQLHRQGITQVVGYFGPIVDELSTRAEEALYDAIAQGHPTRHAVRRARQALAKPFIGPDARHRPRQFRPGPHTRENEQHAAQNEINAKQHAGQSNAAQEAQQRAQAALDTHPFAWAQLVLYHRGPDFPLSTKAEPGQVAASRALQRRFDGHGKRKILRTGFIGRRTELHNIRRKIRKGQRIFVFQGLGGLGKSTLAQHMLPMLQKDPARVCTLWCQETVNEHDQAEALIAQLLTFAREHFGPIFEQVVFQLDRAAPATSQRFLMLLGAMAQKMDGLVLYLDNLESLLIGPDDDNAQSFGQWSTDELSQCWAAAAELANNGRLHLVASVRYCHDDYEDALLPVSPFPAGALFRLTEWFPSLQRLSVPARARLVEQLDGHPRAIEYADDLIRHALSRYRRRHGEWQLPVIPTEQDIKHEWAKLVAPALPEVEKKLRTNLLLQAIWDNVLNDPARRMLMRMTILRRPSRWPLLVLLGDGADAGAGEEGTASDEGTAAGEATAEHLRTTSLLEQIEQMEKVDAQRVERITRYALHPAIREFVGTAYGEAPKLLQEAHFRAGKWFQREVYTKKRLEDGTEGGHHCLEAHDFGTAYDLLLPASILIMKQGHVHAGLLLIEPLLSPPATNALGERRSGVVFGTIAVGYEKLGKVRIALDYHERAAQLMHDSGDLELEGRALGGKGHSLFLLGQLKPSVKALQRALSIANQLDDSVGKTSALDGLGNAYARLGEFDEAMKARQQQLLLAKSHQDQHGQANALKALAQLHSTRGDLKQAQRYAKRCLEVARKAGAPHTEASALGGLGTIQLRAGNLGRALECFDAQLVVARRISHRRSESSALANSGCVLVALNRVEEGIARYKAALLLSRQLGDQDSEGALLGNLGEAYLKLNRLNDAQANITKSLKIARDVGSCAAEANALGNLGLYFIAQGQPDEAAKCLKQALDIGSAIKDKQIITTSHNLLKRLEDES